MTLTTRVENENINGGLGKNTGLFWNVSLPLVRCRSRYILCRNAEVGVEVEVEAGVGVGAAFVGAFEAK